MNTTGFIQNQNPHKVVISKRSRNVWSKHADVNIHTTFSVCVYVDKYGTPPLLVLPEKRLNRDVIEGWDIEGANITTATKGLSILLYFKAGLNYLITLFLIQLRTCLSWFVMAVEAIKIIQL